MTKSVIASMSYISANRFTSGGEDVESIRMGKPFPASLSMDLRHYDAR